MVFFLYLIKWNLEFFLTFWLLFLEGQKETLLKFFPMWRQCCGISFFFSEQSLTTLGTSTKNRKHANAKQVLLISKDGIKLTANTFTKITSKQTLNTTGRRWLFRINLTYFHLKNTDWTTSGLVCHSYGCFFL